MQFSEKFASLSAVALGLAVSSGAVADEPDQSVILRASNSQVFAVRAKVEGSYNGLGRDAVLKNVETVIYDTEDDSDIEVVYINDCKNYDGVPFTAYLSCPALRDAAHDRSVAKLDVATCRSDEPSYHTSFNFNYKGGWYVQGRRGYYSAQRCQPRVAIRVGETWLHDPITDSNDFGIQLDYAQACPQGC